MCRAINKKSSPTGMLTQSLKLWMQAKNSITSITCITLQALTSQNGQTVFDHFVRLALVLHTRKIRSSVQVYLTIFWGWRLKKLHIMKPWLRSIFERMASCSHKGRSWLGVYQIYQLLTHLTTLMVRWEKSVELQIVGSDSI